MRKMQVCEVSRDYHVENIVPFFQPISDLTQDRVWGYESLARLIREDQHVCLPSEFLYLLQKDSCYGDLTRKIFHSSAQYFRDVQVNWSINITEKDVLNPHTLSFLKDYLLDYPNAHRVMLEISANTLFSYPEQFKAFLLLSKTLGIQIVVDRFAEPLTQLQRVLDFPIDGFKIDASRHLHGDVSTHTFLKLKEKAQNNDIFVIAEQIENHACLESVMALGIQYGQGFFISYPQSEAV